jgi:ParE toxin of type II toxin-antitoxin system, parDE
MEIEPYKIEVTEKFIQNFEEIYQYIQVQSYQASQRIRKELIDVIALIAERPESFNIYKKAASNKLFRYAKLMRYKVYFYEKDGIVYIIDILHERRSSEALDYTDEI